MARRSQGDRVGIVESGRSVACNRRANPSAAARLRAAASGSALRYVPLTDNSLPLLHVIVDIVNPAEIAAKILTLVAESDRYLVVVSPYNDIRGWTKTRKYFQRALDRKVEIKYFVRKGETPKGFGGLDISFFEIENLHAKIYLNEKSAVVTSMNLIKASDDKSLDIGMQTTTTDEHQQIVDFVNRYVLGKPTQAPEATISVQSHSNVALATPAIDDGPVFEEFYRRQANWKEIARAQIEKSFHPGTATISSFGYTLNRRRISQWLSFEPNGLLRFFDTYHRGDRVQRQAISYDSGKAPSRYWTLMSIGNMVGSIYGCSIRELWFESKVDAYCPDGGRDLYLAIEKAFNTELALRDHGDFDALTVDLDSSLRR